MPTFQFITINRHSPAVEVYLRRILKNTELIMADTAQTLVDLAAANTALDNIVSDIAALEALIAAGGTPQEVADAVHTLAERTAAIAAAR